MSQHPNIDTARSLLFVPGDRPDRFVRAAAAGADIVVIDLEDSVGAAQKEAARRHAQAWLESGNTAMIRVNAAGTHWHHDDVWMSAALGAAIMLPKAERVETVAGVAAQLGEAGLVPLIETALGVAVASDVASLPGVSRIAFGSVDYAAQVGVAPTDREALLYARSALVVASACAGLASPVDGVTTALSNLELVGDDTRYARRLGMLAKLCIHPAQVERVHRGLTPTQQELTWADRVVRASANGSVATVDGEMVDAPVARRARQIVAAARG